MTVQAMTPQRREERAKSFGKGLIVFGAQRPQESAQNSNSQPLDAPKHPWEIEDSAVTLERSITQRFPLPSTTATSQESKA